MKNYLAIIRRADFIDLFKYGFFYLNKELIVYFDCDVKDLHSHDELFDGLFSRINSFESSFAYLIIHYTKNDDIVEYSDVSIEEVMHIFPLNLEAKKEFEASFDEHIKIDMPIRNDTISLLQKKQMFNSSMQGVNNVFNIFKLDKVNFCKQILDDNTVEEMLSDVYDNKRPSGKLSLWVYLMRYERHSYYPKKETLGYFMDIVHIVCNYMEKREVEDYEVEGTAIYKILDTYRDKQLKSIEIIKILNSDERAAGFMNKILEFVPDVDFINTAVSYLKLRDQYKEEFVYDAAFVESCKKAFEDSFTLACYMLGIALAHDKTYSCLYENLPLAIYKTKEEMQEIEYRKELERKRAKLEMKRMEEEREHERQLEQERRNSKKKGKKTSGYDSYGRQGYVKSKGSYTSGLGHVSESFPPFQEEGRFVHEPSFRENNIETTEKIIPSSIGQKERGSKQKEAEQKSDTNSLFGQEEMDKMATESRQKVRFPTTFRKYRKDGKTPSMSKGKTVEVTIHDFNELQTFLSSKDYKNNNWKRI